MLANRLRRWPNITPALVQCFVLADESLGLVRHCEFLNNPIPGSFNQPEKGNLLKAHQPRAKAALVSSLSLYTVN